ncbi:MAG: LapA family protein [Nitriliruptoraceae bacterium]
MSSATPPDPDRPTGPAGSGSEQGSGSRPGDATSSDRRSSGPDGAAGSYRDGATGSDRDGAEAPETPVEGKPSTPFTQQLGRITIVVLAVLFVVFALANSQPVDFSWVFGETIARDGAGGEVTGGVPLILLLIGAFIAGSLITFLTELYVGRGRRARRAAKERARQEGTKGRKGRKDRT